jgi:4-hydroxybenzoate polyprenyltransferase
MKKLVKNNLYQTLRANLDCLSELIDKFQDRMKKNPYTHLMRMHSLAGFWLLIMPVWWSVALAVNDSTQAGFYLLVSTLGAFLMRSGGCIINDLIDRKVDKLVKRTAKRPLAAGTISIKAAFILLTIILSLTFALAVALPFEMLKWAATIMVLVCAYPFFKRFTSYAQIFLGMVFNSGILLMWFSISPKANFIPLVLYFAAILWTIAYDTVYAFQDSVDDKKIGLKSLALKLGSQANDFIWNIYQLMTVSVCIAGLARYLNPAFFVIVGMGVYWFYPKVKTIDLKDSKACAHLFQLNVYYGLIITIAIFIGLL